MSPLIRPATSAPIVPRLPGGALAPTSGGGALVRSPAGQLIRNAGGAAVPWVQRITTGLAAGAAGIPAAALAVPAAVGAATLPWAARNWRGGPGAESMAERRGLSTREPAARTPHKGPAYGNVTSNPQAGGGNAGRSTASQWAPPAAPPPPPVSSAGSWAPAAQGNPRVPAGRNVAIVNPPHRAQNRALDIAAQNAGLPAWNWKAEENAAMLQAAEARGQAASAAREAQGGRGYITADNLPAALDQSKGGYWQGADMQAWAAANPELAKQAMARAGYNPQQEMLPGLAAAAAQAPASGPGATNGAEWSFAKPTGELSSQLARGAAAAPGYDIEGMSGPDFQAPTQAPASWRVQNMTMPASGPGASTGADWSFAGPSGPVTRPLAAAAAAAPGYDANALSGPGFAVPPAPPQAMPLSQDQRFPTPGGSVLPDGAPVIDDQAQARLQDYLQRIKNLNPTEWNFSRRVG